MNSPQAKKKNNESCCSACCCKEAKQAATGPSKDVPTLTPDWDAADYLGMIRVRLGFNRMDYGIAPGLYAMGRPDSESPVLVSANYKLTVDLLRRELAGFDVWILVLDTAKVNVWCAAGKDSFGTAELQSRIEAVSLSERVSHRQLILPQLGASGVAAHEIRKRTGFRVVYGPVRARDLPAFLENGLTATTEMRQVKFPWTDRLVLTPIELRGFFLPAALLALALALLPMLFQGVQAGFFKYGWRGALAVLTGWLGGCLLGPVLLPWLPGRAFAVKGGFLGAVLGIGLAAIGMFGSWTATAGSVLLLSAMVSFFLMNFTGCATFTSQSGVKAELRSIPIQIILAVVGLAVWSIDWWL